MPCKNSKTILLQNATDLKQFVKVHIPNNLLNNLHLPDHMNKTIPKNNYKMLIK